MEISAFEEKKGTIFINFFISIYFSTFFFFCYDINNYHLFLTDLFFYSFLFIAFRKVSQSFINHLFIISPAINKMLIEIILLITSLTLCAFYLMYYSPKKKIERFINDAETQGYRVKVMPFHPLKYYMADFQQQHNGSLKTLKQEIPNNYDFVVGNLFTTLAVMPVSTQLQRDFYNSLNKLPKNPFISEVFLKFLNGGGLLFTEGETWRRKRRIISSVFHYDFINDIIPAIEDQMDYYFVQIDHAIAKNTMINVQLLFVKILSSVIAKCFFGTDMKEQEIEGRAYSDYFISYLEETNLFTMSSDHAFLGMLGPKYGLTARCRQLVRKLKIIRAVTKQICMKELEKLKTRDEMPKNLLTTLYKNNLLNFNQHQNPDQYSFQELIGQFFTFVGAGTDTTSHSINLMMHYLSQYPEYLQKIRQEVKALSQEKELSNSDRVKKMIWTEAIFNEVLRINGPIADIIPRISRQEVTLGGVKVPRGTCFNVLPLINHYNPAYFSQPSKFIPERWLKQSKIQPYAFTPFAAGERSCIGQYLARTEVKLAMWKLVQKYEFKSVHPIDMRKKFFYVTEHGEFQFKKKV